MSILLWTFAPIIVLVLAIVWAHWAARPRPPAQAKESVEEFDKFRRAIQAPLTAPTQTDRRRHSSSARQPAD